MAVCIVETWAMNNNFILPTWLENFTPFYSNAVKIKQRGRASGDIVTFINNAIIKNKGNVVILETNQYMIIVTFQLIKLCC